MQRLICHVGLHRESLPRDNRSHAPDEARSKCLDLSSICIAANVVDGVRASIAKHIQQSCHLCLGYVKLGYVQFR